MSTHDYPRILWLQYYDDDGVELDPEERTFSPYRVTRFDACYMRWGKTHLMPKLDEFDRLKSRVESQNRVIDDLADQLCAAGYEVGIVRDTDGTAIGATVTR